ncbi:MAG: hypothetical protein ABR909_06590 [Candidatus Bathyarchaeia archaeon]|jgi:hypothetical protein
MTRENVSYDNVEIKKSRISMDSMRQPMIQGGRISLGNISDESRISYTNLSNKSQGQAKNTGKK